MPDDVDNLEERLRRRAAMQRNPLETVPETNKPRGNIPNTPLAASTISFLLGSFFTAGAATFLSGGFSKYWWTTAQLGFFVAAWSGFHWGEFAVTAGWNLEKCSIDCECGEAISHTLLLNHRTRSFSA